MNMESVVRVAASTPRTRASRFIERYSACRGSLAQRVEQEVVTVAATDAETAPARFEHLFTRAFTAARD